MKIIHISNLMEEEGASIATTRLKKALLDKKCDSSIWVNYKMEIILNKNLSKYFSKEN
ncbi:MAG: hypothetical protein CM15mP109_07310 [Candidatus Dadabacteria bacterium]|nr:MAG: hypothetical protein CM15mP109_07310 [Candidatus Dadabacteria bacterium]